MLYGHVRSGRISTRLVLAGLSRMTASSTPRTGKGGPGSDARPSHAAAGMDTAGIGSLPRTRGRSCPTLVTSCTSKPPRRSRNGSRHGPSSGSLDARGETTGMGGAGRTLTWRCRGRRDGGGSPPGNRRCNLQPGRSEPSGECCSSMRATISRCRGRVPRRKLWPPSGSPPHAADGSPRCLRS
jgi:hypothetical protein